MPQVETSDLNQDAVLWPAGKSDGYGRNKVGSPIPIKSRWDLGNTLSSSNLERNQDVTGTVAVDRMIKVGSVLRRGKVKGMPTPITDLYEVVSYNETPDIKARHFRRSVVVARYPDELPTAL